MIKKISNSALLDLLRDVIPPTSTGWTGQFTPKEIFSEVSRRLLIDEPRKQSSSSQLQRDDPRRY